MNKPSWNDAPDWAMFLAIGHNTQEYEWFELYPVLYYGGWYANEGKNVNCDKYNELKNSIEERPNE